MDDTVVFVFPSRTQLEVIAREAERFAGSVVALVPDPAEDCGRVRVIGEAAVTGGAVDLSRARWSCCGELGVYFVSANRRRAGRLSFGPVCLDMLTKLDMLRAFCLAGVHPTPKQPLRDALHAGTLSFPCVVKPNFGFASALVKRVSSMDELRAYTRAYAEARASSLARAYGARYLAHRPQEELDEILVEPDLSAGTFLSVPFHVAAGELRGVYPVAGERVRAGAGSDYEWEGFAYPAGLGDGELRAVRETLEGIARYCALETGVFEAELLLDRETGVVRVLEFSPRITGGSLPELIRAACGTDLHRLAVAAALGAAYEPAETHRRPCRLVRTPAGQGGGGEAGEVVARFEKRSGGALFHDTIHAMA